MPKHKRTMKQYVTLKTHFDALREADQLRYTDLRTADAAAIAAALAAAEKAVTKAESANERRFENTNEWRSTYGDLANRSRGAWQLILSVVAAAGVFAAIMALILNITRG